MTFFDVLSFIATATLAYARDFDLSDEWGFDGWAVLINTDHVDLSAFVHLTPCPEYVSEVGIGGLEWTVAPMWLDECYHEVTGEHWPF